MVGAQDGEFHPERTTGTSLNIICSCQCLIFLVKSCHTANRLSVSLIIGRSLASRVQLFCPSSTKTEQSYVRLIFSTVKFFAKSGKVQQRKILIFLLYQKFADHPSRAGTKPSNFKLSHVRHAGQDLILS